MKVNWLVNHVLMLSILLLSGAAVYAFCFVVMSWPSDRCLGAAANLMAWLNALWLVAVAIELDVFGLKARAQVVWAIAFTGFSGSFVFWGFFAPLMKPEAANEIARGAVAVFASFYFTLAAVTADKVSSSLGGRLAAFWVLLNWPVFLFSLSHAILRAAERSRKQQIEVSCF